MKKIKVLLVDDHALLREGIHSLLELHDDIQVVGEAGDGEEAIRKAVKLNPDIVVMDISMPTLSGIEATRMILKEKPGIKIVVLSRHDNLNYARSMLKAGALGYVPKKVISAELVEAIRAVNEGGVFLHHSIAKAVTEDYVQRVQLSPEDDLYEHLTEREKDILRLMAEGYTIHQIAERLSLASKTVFNHRRNLMEKLGTETPTQLAAYAMKIGLLDTETY